MIFVFLNVFVCYSNPIKRIREEKIVNKFVTRKGTVIASVLAIAIASAGTLVGCQNASAPDNSSQTTSSVQAEATTQTPIEQDNKVSEPDTDDSDSIVSVDSPTDHKTPAARKKGAKVSGDTNPAPEKETVMADQTIVPVSTGKTMGSTSAGGNGSVSKITDNTVPGKTDSDLCMDGYTLQWEDLFNGTELDRNTWNVELHAPGWVNSELQEYVDSADNISVADGCLAIRPVKTVDENGNVSYTSGRINTQNKQSFTYGLFEARVKVPSGQGYLPAFWLMAQDENVYGQWPRCGEIDCMEVMGQDPTTAYGTIHYGNPHQESQGTCQTASNHSFSDEFHTFACEWEPGSIKWYVDGHLYHEEHDWYSTTTGQGTLSYPAPFDQPFYIILNLAVGGSWVGNPDDTTSFDDQAYLVDYVKVYQKESYNENVSRPKKDVILREPNADGNYINNGSFTVAENLSDDSDWKFMTALGGDATAAIADNTMTITTASDGTVDYSVQLVQAGLPLEKGATYQVSFDASASGERTMKTAIKAPDHGYCEYMGSKTVNLSTTPHTYTYDFKMADESDANARLEFNMGAAGSTETICLRNVSVTKIADANPDEVPEKTILADGNYIYNGGFQEGDSHLGDWEITNNGQAGISVTSFADGRRLQIVGTAALQPSDVILAQRDLAFVPGTAYAVSFQAESTLDRELPVTVGGNTYSVNVTAGKGTYSFVIPASATFTNTDISFALGGDGTLLLDNIRLEENAMIKNGSFKSGISGYEIYVADDADADYVVDSLTEDDALDFTIRNVSSADWKIQVKQNNITLEKGHWYTLTFQAKSTISRSIRAIMQGGEDKGYAVYSGENTVNLTTDYQTFTKTFCMYDDTDTAAFLSICLGKTQDDILTPHRVILDNIQLEEVEAPALPASSNLLQNADFADGIDHWTCTIANWDDSVTADASYELRDGSILFAIQNPGTEDWHVQLKQSHIALENGQTYRVSYTITSTKARSYKCGIMSTAYAWYGGLPDENAVLEENVPADESFTFTMSCDDTDADFYISLGKVGETPASDVTISNLKIEKVAN